MAHTMEDEFINTGRPCAPRPSNGRIPLQDLNIIPDCEDDTTTTTSTFATLQKRRVSFNNKFNIKEFNTEDRTIHVLHAPEYEEHLSCMSSDSSCHRTSNSTASIVSQNELVEHSKYELMEVSTSTVSTSTATATKKQVCEVTEIENQVKYYNSEESCVTKQHKRKSIGSCMEITSNYIDVEQNVGVKPSMDISEKSNNSSMDVDITEGINVPPVSLTMMSNNESVCTNEESDMSFTRPIPASAITNGNHLNITRPDNSQLNCSTEDDNLSLTGAVMIANNASDLSMTRAIPSGNYNASEMSIMRTTLLGNNSNNRSKLIGFNVGHMNMNQMPSTGHNISSMNMTHLGNVRSDFNTTRNQSVGVNDMDMSMTQAFSLGNNSNLSDMSITRAVSLGNNNNASDMSMTRAVSLGNNASDMSMARKISLGNHNNASDMTMTRGISPGPNNSISNMSMTRVVSLGNHKNASDMSMTRAVSLGNNASDMSMTRTVSLGNNNNATDMSMARAVALRNNNNASDMSMTQAVSLGKNNNASDMSMTQAVSLGTNNNASDMSMTRAVSLGNHNNASDISMTRAVSLRNHNNASDMSMTRAVSLGNNNNASDMSMTRAVSLGKNNNASDMSMTRAVALRNNNNASDMSMTRAVSLRNNTTNASMTRIPLGSDTNNMSLAHSRTMGTTDMITTGCPSVVSTSDTSMTRAPLVEINPTNMSVLQSRTMGITDMRTKGCPAVANGSDISMTLAAASGMASNMSLIQIPSTETNAILNQISSMERITKAIPTLGGDTCELNKFCSIASNNGSVIDEVTHSKNICVSDMSIAKHVPVGDVINGSKHIPLLADLEENKCANNNTDDAVQLINHTCNNMNNQSVTVYEADSSSRDGTSISFTNIATHDKILNNISSKHIIHDKSYENVDVNRENNFVSDQQISENGDYDDTSFGITCNIVGTSYRNKRNSMIPLDLTKPSDFELIKEVSVTENDEIHVQNESSIHKQKTDLLRSDFDVENSNRHMTEIQSDNVSLNNETNDKCHAIPDPEQKLEDEIVNLNIQEQLSVVSINNDDNVTKNISCDIQTVSPDKNKLHDKYHENMDVTDRDHMENDNVIINSTKTDIDVNSKTNFEVLNVTEKEISSQNVIFHNNTIESDNNQFKSIEDIQNEIVNDHCQPMAEKNDLELSEMNVESKCTNNVTYNSNNSSISNNDNILKISDDDLKNLDLTFVTVRKSKNKNDCGKYSNVSSCPENLNIVGKNNEELKRDQHVVSTILTDGICSTVHKDPIEGNLTAPTKRKSADSFDPMEDDDIKSAYKNRRKEITNTCADMPGENENIIVSISKELQNVDVVSSISMDTSERILTSNTSFDLENGMDIDMLNSELMMEEQSLMPSADRRFEFPFSLEFRKHKEYCSYDYLSTTVHCWLFFAGVLNLTVELDTNDYTVVKEIKISVNKSEEDDHFMLFARNVKNKFESELTKCKCPNDVSNLILSIIDHVKRNELVYSDLSRCFRLYPLQNLDDNRLMYEVVGGKHRWWFQIIMSSDILWHPIYDSEISLNTIISGSSPVRLSDVQQLLLLSSTSSEHQLIKFIKLLEEFKDQSFPYV